MTTMRRLSLLLLLFGLTTLASCLSSGPPAPPVRWLDPTAAFADVAPVAGRAAVRVRAQPHLVQDIAVRIGAVEVAYDPDHRWLLPPDEVLRRAFARAQVPLGDGGRLVELTEFELQRVGSVRAARVACLVQPAAGAAAVPVRHDVVVGAGDDSLEALTRAMAKAVQDLVAQVR